MAVLRKDGQVELSSFHLNPNTLEMTFDNQHIKAMKVENPMDTTLHLALVKGFLLVLTASKDV